MHHSSAVQHQKSCLLHFRECCSNTMWVLQNPVMQALLSHTKQVRSSDRPSCAYSWDKPKSRQTSFGASARAFTRQNCSFTEVKRRTNRLIPTLIQTSISSRSSWENAEKAEAQSLFSTNLKVPGHVHSIAWANITQVSQMQNYNLAKQPTETSR